MESGLLTNRELASLIWLGVLATYIAVQARRDTKLGASLISIVRQFLGYRILVPFLLYLAWLFAAVWLFSMTELWNSDLLKPTIMWTVLSGLGLFFSFDKALRQQTFWREAFAASLGAGLFVEFYIGLVSFPFVVELMLQPVLILMVSAAGLAVTLPGREPIQRATNWVLGIVGGAALVWVSWSLLERWAEFEVSQLLLELFLPVWLTPIALAFVYLLALFAGYENAFNRMSRMSGPSWRAKLAYISLVGIRVDKLRAFDGGVQMAGAAETSISDSRSAMIEERRRRSEMLRPKIEPTPIGVDQLEWSITTSGGRVTLKGDLPNGYPTETWIDRQLLEREPDGVFSWDLEVGLPDTVSLIKQHTDCWLVQREIEMWDRLASSAPTHVGAVRCRAYAQAAREQATELGCK